MKKFISIITIIGLCMIPLFAEVSADGDKLGSGENGTATVDIKFDLTSDENSKWQIGFTDNIDGLDNNTVTPLSSGEVELSINGKQGTLGEKKLYVYWIIAGGQPLKITLGAKGPLTGTYQQDAGSQSSTEYMNWKVEWTPLASGKEASSGKTVLGTTNSYNSGQIGVDYTAKPVFTREVLDSSREVGSAQLDIETQNIDDVKPVSYGSTLTLTIAPVDIQ